MNNLLLSKRLPALGPRDIPVIHPPIRASVPRTVSSAVSRPSNKKATHREPPINLPRTSQDQYPEIMCPEGIVVAFMDSKDDRPSQGFIPADRRRGFFGCCEWEHAALPFQGTGEWRERVRAQQVCLALKRHRGEEKADEESRWDRCGNTTPGVAGGLLALRTDLLIAGCWMPVIGLDGGNDRLRRGMRDLEKQSSEWTL